MVRLDIALSSKHNPAVWADRIIDKNHKLLLNNSPEDELPNGYVSDDPCGHYGCVYRTNKEHVVFKVTSDITEIKFVELVISMKEEPEGLVQYHRIIKFPGTHRGRPVYGIWREEAFDIGEFDRQDDEQRLMVDMLMSFKQWANIAREAIKRSGYSSDFLSRMVKTIEYYEKSEIISIQGKSVVISLHGGEHKFKYSDWASVLYIFAKGKPEYAYGSVGILSHIKGVYKAALAIKVCEKIAEDLAQQSEGHLIGDAFLFYMKQGILMADVHHNNIGKVIREENYREPVWVITDPGHVLFLGEEYKQQFYTWAYPDD